MPVSGDLIDAQVRHSVYLQRFSGGLANKLIALLNRTDADLVAQLMARDPTAVSGAWSLKRLERLLEEIRVINRDAYNAVGKELRSELRELAAYEAGFQARLLGNTVALNIVQPATEQLYAAVMARPFQGRLLKEWVQDLEAARFARLRDAIRIAFVEGETIDQMVRRVRGTRALGFRDGILEIDRRGVTSVVRTAVAHTANVARESLYAANDSIIKAVRWVSTLDSRTSAVCRGRDGQEYPPNKGPRPPAHWNCRSSTVPVLAEGLELLREGATRASASGQVSAAETYNSWLRRQPREFVEDVLGKTRARLYLDGKLSLDRFVDRNGTELTLEQLRQKDAAAFARAGLRP